MAPASYRAQFLPPADTDVSYRHWSPKLGCHLRPGWPAKRVCGLTTTPSAYPAKASCSARFGDDDPNHRTQTDQGQQLRAGLPWPRRAGLAYTVSAYRMDKRDDILSYKDPVTNATQSVNAGHTAPRRRAQRECPAVAGAGTGAQLWLRFTNTEWEVDPKKAGQQSERQGDGHCRGRSATVCSATPAGERGLRVSAEWVHLGSYWMDAENTENIRVAIAQPARQFAAGTGEWSLFASLNNVTDRRYAESASLAPVMMSRTGHAAHGILASSTKANESAPPSSMLPAPAGGRRLAMRW